MAPLQAESGEINAAVFEQRKLIAETQEKADGGDPKAMLDLSNWYYRGEKGLNVDLSDSILPMDEESRMP